MNRRRPLLGLDPVLLTTAQRRYTGAHAPNNPGLAAKRKRNGQRYSPERRRGKVNNHRNEMAYRGDSVDALIKICLLYTSDAADDLTRVDLGGRRIIKKKK